LRSSVVAQDVAKVMERNIGHLCINTAEARWGGVQVGKNPNKDGNQDEDKVYDLGLGDALTGATTGIAIGL
jgi:hypothetical protein